MARRVGSARAAKTWLRGSRAGAPIAMVVMSSRASLRAPTAAGATVAVRVLEAEKSTPPMSWTSPVSTPLPTSWSRAAATSGTTRWMPFCDPAAMSVMPGTFWPSRIPQWEPGRHDLHDPHVVHLDVVGDQRPAALLDVEVAGPVDVGDGDVHQLEPHLAGVQGWGGGVVVMVDLL